MDIDIVSQYVLSITPAVSAVAGCAAAVFFGIKRAKRLFSDSEKTSRATAKEVREIKDEIKQITRANYELKRENAQLKKKLLGVRLPEVEGDGDQ